MLQLPNLLAPLILKALRCSSHLRHSHRHHRVISSQQDIFINSSLQSANNLGQFLKCLLNLPPSYLLVPAGTTMVAPTPVMHRNRNYCTLKPPLAPCRMCPTNTRGDVSAIPSVRSYPICGRTVDTKPTTFSALPSLQLPWWVSVTASLCTLPADGGPKAGVGSV